MDPTAINIQQYEIIFVFRQTRQELRLVPVATSTILYVQYSSTRNSKMSPELIAAAKQHGQALATAPTTKCSAAAAVAMNLVGILKLVVVVLR